MRDVINLAWKLKLVLTGVCSDKLLTTYQAERDAHAHDLVSWAVALGQLMEFVAEQEACQRRGDPEPKPPEKMASSGYGQGREQPPIRDGAVLTSQICNEGITGYLFNQPIVRQSNGSELHLDELLGGGFALVGYGPINLNDKSRTIVSSLNIKLVDLNGLEIVKGRFAAFEQSEQVLVRPDRLVYGHTTEHLDANQLLASLAQAVSLSVS